MLDPNGTPILSCDLSCDDSIPIYARHVGSADTIEIVGGFVDTEIPRRNVGRDARQVYPGDEIPIYIEGFKVK